MALIACLILALPLIAGTEVVHYPGFEEVTKDVTFRVESAAYPVATRQASECLPPGGPSHLIEA